MKNFEIWIEGFAATGQSQGASFEGKAEGKDFLEACLKFKQPEDIYDYCGKNIIVKKGSPLNLDKNPDGTVRLSKDGHPMSWACRYFDNEKDARKSFG